jgi:GNAT superfamily N-acetyltransferase
MGITAREIDTGNQRDVRRFVDFPFDLYRTSRLWSPPLRGGVRRVLDRTRHSFYRHSEAAFFVAEDGGRVKARVAVLENRRYNAYTGKPAALFNWFDAENDVEAARAVLGAAAAWAKARGLTVLVGPKGMLRTDCPGILVEGFEHEAALGMNYNYDYYPRLLEAAGFVKEIDYLSGYLAKGYGLPARMAGLVEKIRERSGLRVHTFRSKRELKRWIPALQEINNVSFGHVWGFYPIDADEARESGRQLLQVADPKLLSVVLKGDEIAGFMFVFRDVSAALRKTRGRLWPFGWVRILWSLKTSRRLSGNGIGLLPRYQGKGATSLLYAEMSRTLTAVKAVHCDVALALETNVKSLADMNAIGTDWYKRHRVYRRALVPEREAPAPPKG